jgi:hypothetical protein
MRILNPQLLRSGSKIIRPWLFRGFVVRPVVDDMVKAAVGYPANIIHRDLSGDKKAP